MSRTLIISAMLPSQYKGGAEKIAQLCIDELRSTTNEPLILTHKKSRYGNGSFLPVFFGNICSPNKITQKGVLVKLIYHLLDIFNPILLLELIYLFTAKKVKVIYAHNITYFGFNVLIASRVCGIKYVQFSHDYYYTCVKSSRFRAGRNCEKTCTSCALLRAPVKLFSQSVEAAFVSQAIQSSITSELKFSSTQVLYNPKQNVANNDLVSSKQAPEFTLGYLGAISENKGILQFLQAHLPLLESLGVNMMIAGSGEGQYFQDFLTLVNTHPSINYLGQTAPERFFPKIKFLLVPSLWNEPLATVILEAIAYGVPVIANHTGGSCEMIDQGQTGYCLDLFDNTNSKEQLQQIFSLSENDYQALQKNIKAKDWPSKEDWIETILNI